MYMRDIKSLEGIKVREIALGSLGLTEQETIIVNNREDKKREVDSSHQPEIRKILNSEFFELEEILVSNKKGSEGFILEIKGKMEKKGIIIRNKKPVFSDEEKKRRVARILNSLSRVPDDQEDGENQEE